MHAIDAIVLSDSIVIHFPKLDLKGLIRSHSFKY